jgi:hypothetical protein
MVQGEEARGRGDSAWCKVKKGSPEITAWCKGVSPWASAQFTAAPAASRWCNTARAGTAERAARSNGASPPILDALTSGADKGLNPAMTKNRRVQERKCEG